MSDDRICPGSASAAYQRGRIDGAREQLRTTRAVAPHALAMRVVEAARAWRDLPLGDDQDEERALMDAVDAYEASDCAGVPPRAQIDHESSPSDENGNDSADVSVRAESSSIATSSRETPSSGKARWRVGRKLGRTIYCDDMIEGMLDSRELAVRIVELLNAADSDTKGPADGC